MNKLILLALLFFTPQPSQAAFTEVDRAFLAAKNLLKNPGWENGKTNWTASSGTYTTTTTAAQIGSGNAAASWDASATSQTLTSAAVAIPAGGYGQNGAASCKFLCASGTCTHTISAYDGSNTLASATITSSTSIYNRTSVNFIFPSSGNIQLRITSAADEPIAYIDDCYLGLADSFNASQISQAQFIGSAYFATTASCAWARTNTAEGAFSTDTDCPGPTVELNPGPGTIQTTDADLPQVTVNNLPPGYYAVTFELAATVGSAVRSTFTISDGTTTSGKLGVDTDSTNDANNGSLTGYFSYSTSGNRTFALFTSSTSGAVTLENDSGNLSTRFSIVRYPSSPEQAYRASQTPASWSGYHQADCSWARTNAAYGDPTADATCTFTESKNRNFGTVTSYLSGSDKLPGIVFTPPRAGRYLVTATFASYAGANVANYYRLTDGTTTVGESQLQVDSASQQKPVTIIGVYDAASVASTTLRIQSGSAGTVTIGGSTTPNVALLWWSIVELDAAMPAPLLVGSVTSGSTGLERVNRVTFSGNAGATTVCSSSPCTISSQSGSWVSTVTRGGTGGYTVNFTAGEFSSAPTCVCSGLDLAALVYCAMNGVVATTSAVTIFTRTAAAAADEAVSLICLGAH